MKRPRLAALCAAFLLLTACESSAEGSTDTGAPAVAVADAAVIETTSPPVASGTTAPPFTAASSTPTPSTSTSTTLVIREFDPRVVGPYVFSPMDWGIILDSAGPGVHLVHMVVEVRPTPESRAEVPEEETFEVSGRLVWDETVVDLCGVQDRRYYDPRWGPGNDEVDPAQWEGFMWIGDIFYTDEWCTWSWSKSELQSAFDDFGMPEQACVDFTADDLTYELCEPLYELPATYNWNWTD